MKPIVADTDDRRWQAVCERDTRADGQFVFAVLTTGICCRPSCRSRRARRENVRFFADVAAAVAAGFRPCKRCQPDKDYPQQQRVDKVAQACRLLEQDAPLTLEALAGQLAMSPFHFHRLFKSVTGMTPKAWQQAWRAQRLREALEQGIPVTRAAGGWFSRQQQLLSPGRRSVRDDSQPVSPRRRRHRGNLDHGRLRAGSLPGGAERARRLRGAAG